MDSKKRQAQRRAAKKAKRAKRPADRTKDRIAEDRVRRMHNESTLSPKERAMRRTFKGIQARKTYREGGLGG